MRTNEKPATTETRILSGALLLAYGFLGMIAPSIPLPTGTPFTLDGLPPQIAWLCAPLAAIVILTSLADKADGAEATGLYHCFGRWFWHAGLFAVALSAALALTRTSFADDLLHRQRLVAVVALTLGILAVLSYVSRRTGPRPPVDAAPPGRLKTVLAVLLSSAAGFMLYQRYVEHQARESGYAAQDATERRTAPPWLHEMSAFQGGQTVEEIRTILRGSGHSLRCFSDLRSENRLRQDDRVNCWAMVGEAWGAPALTTVFWFGDEGLRAHMLRFPESSWPKLERKLDASGQRLAFPVGRDADSGGPVIGWRLDSGLVMSAAPAPGTEISVLWTAKRQLAREHCPLQPGRGRSPHPEDYVLPMAELWPDIDCRDYRDQ